MVTHRATPGSTHGIYRTLILPSFHPSFLSANVNQHDRQTHRPARKTLPTQTRFTPSLPMCCKLSACKFPVLPTISQNPTPNPKTTRVPVRTKPQQSQSRERKRAGEARTPAEAQTHKHAPRANKPCRIPLAFHERKPAQPASKKIESVNRNKKSATVWFHPLPENPRSNRPRSRIFSRPTPKPYHEPL